MPEARSDEKTMTVDENVEHIAYVKEKEGEYAANVEEERKEVVADIEEDREPDAEFADFRNLRPGFRLCYSEDDIKEFGFVGAVYIGAVQSGLNYVHDNVVWLTKTRPEERRDLMVKMAAEMDAAREAAAMPPERQETQDASQKGAMTPWQGAAANKEKQEQAQERANDVHLLQTRSEAVSQEQRAYTQERNNANALTTGKTTRRERREANKAARQARRETKEAARQAKRGGGRV